MCSFCPELRDPLRLKSSTEHVILLAKKGMLFGFRLFLKGMGLSIFSYPFQGADLYVDPRKKEPTPADTPKKRKPVCIPIESWNPQKITVKPPKRSPLRVERFFTYFTVSLNKWHLARSPKNSLLAPCVLAFLGDPTTSLRNMVSSCWWVLIPVKPICLNTLESKSCVNRPWILHPNIT